MSTAGQRNSTSDSWSEARLSPGDFARLGEWIQRGCGIRMPASKRITVETRLRKRLRALGLADFRGYCEYVFSAAGEGERTHLVDAITTNKTDFFREPQHFEYLVRAALPALVGARGAGVRRPLAVWSAGCSSGEEPYTLAMVLNEVAEGMPGFRFLLLATDLSTAVLRRAAQATYDEERIAPIPLPLRKKYLLRSMDRSRGLVRVAPEVREHVRFRQLNFMDDDFRLREPMDVIFCRNVMIYFDRPTQAAVLNRFCRHLEPGGYVFLGHSETINGLAVPLRQVAPTIYRLAG
ncbi:MAG: protein-glutamate O-methyltransferase [Proteobacteria bacterium]|nr:protein-glutamate O-methyltransferase [Pseudomonadota bacterium]